MPSLTLCPELLPRELISLIESFGNVWAASPFRPKPAPHVVEHWSQLLYEWARRLSENSRGLVKKQCIYE